MNKKRNGGFAVFVIIAAIIAATVLIAQYLCSVNETLRSLSLRMNEDDYDDKGEEDESIPDEIEVENVK